MKRSIIFVFSGIIACASLATQAQNHRAEPSHNGNQHQQANQHPQNRLPQHASRDRGSFKHNGKSQEFRRGQKLPSQYRSKAHYVDNYSAYHLSKPSNGHRWVRDDSGNFMLIAVASGLITQILSGN